jgi:hypothetical protein
MNAKNPSTRKSSRVKTPLFENAPELLLQKIAQLNGVLAKYRNADHNPSVLEFYEEVLRVMRLAYTYMQETKWIFRRNSLVENNLQFLAQYNQELQTRLDEIETVTRLKQQDRLDEVLDLSDDYVERVLSIRSKAGMTVGEKPS